MTIRSQSVSPSSATAMMRGVESPSTVVAESAMRRILLVDDQAHVLRVMRVCLDRNGYEVDTALSAEVALRMMKQQRYDVLIADFDLPGMSAHQLCECVSRQLDEAAPFVLLIAAECDIARIGEWKPSPLDIETLERPVSLRYLVARLSEFFGDFDAVSRHHAHD